MSADSKIDCFRDANDAIKAGDIVLLKKDFKYFLENDSSPAFAQSNARLDEFLESASGSHQKICFDFILDFCSEELKEEAPLIWAAANQSSENVTKLVPSAQGHHIDRAVGIAIQSGRLDNLQVLLPKFSGTVKGLEPLWLAVYHHQKDIFNYLMTTSYLPKQARGTHNTWNNMLGACVIYDFLSVFDDIVPHADLSGDDGKGVLMMALRHNNPDAVDLLYPLYSKKDIDEIAAQLEKIGEGDHAQVLRQRIAQEEKEAIGGALEITKKSISKERKM